MQNKRKLSQFLFGALFALLFISIPKEAFSQGNLTCTAANTICNTTAANCEPGYLPPQQICEHFTTTSCPATIACVPENVYPTSTPVPPTPTNSPTPTPMVVPNCQGGGRYTVTDGSGGSVDQPFPYVGSGSVPEYHFHFSGDETQAHEYRIAWKYGILTKYIDLNSEVTGDFDITVRNIVGFHSDGGFYDVEGTRTFWLEYKSGAGWNRYPSYTSCEAYIAPAPTPTSNLRQTCEITAAAVSSTSFTISLSFEDSTLNKIPAGYRFLVWSANNPSAISLDQPLAANSLLEDNKLTLTHTPVTGLISTEVYYATLLRPASYNPADKVSFCPLLSLNPSSDPNISPGVTVNPTPVAPTNTPPPKLKKVCENIDESDPEYQQCVNCQNKSGAYTAIGCVPVDPSAFLRDYIFTYGLGIAGGIAFLLMLWGGFTILTSQGDPQKVAHGREIMISAFAGLLFIIFSVFILRVIGIDILRIPFFSST